MDAENEEILWHTVRNEMDNDLVRDGVSHDSESSHGQNRPPKEMTRPLAAKLKVASSE